MDGKRARGTAADRPEDLEYVTIVDRPHEAMEIIEKSYVQFQEAQIKAREETPAERLLEATEALTDEMREEIDIELELAHGAMEMLLPPA